MSRESFIPSVNFDSKKADKPKTKRGRVLKKVLASGAVLGLVAYADFAQTGVRGVFEHYAESGTLNMVPFGDSSNTCKVQEDIPQAEVIKNKIQQSFGVNVLSPDNIPSIETYKENGDRIITNTIEWDTKSLASLYQALCAVPDDMYSTRVEEEKRYELNFGTNPVIQDYFKNGLPEGINVFEFTFPNGVTLSMSRKDMQNGLALLKEGFNQTYSSATIHNIDMQFVLVEKDFESGNVVAHGMYNHGSFFNSQEDMVVLVRKPESEYAFYLQTIIHEIAHRIHAVQREKMDPELFEILGVKDHLEFKEAKFIKEGKVHSVASSFKRAFETTKKEKSITMGLLALLQWESIDELLEYGNTNPNEFTSVGAGYYIYGKENFLTIYSNFMGSEKADKFYNFLKKNVFAEKEF